MVLNRRCTNCVQNSVNSLSPKFTLIIAIRYIPVYVVLLSVLLSACKKDEQFIPGNTPPPYDEIPTLLLENYINRVYIDLLGREPLDVEMTAEVNTLREGDVSPEARRALLVKLQSDSSFVEGDGSYKQAYYQRLYDLFKVRMVEGASDALFNQYRAQYRSKATKDSLSNDMPSYEASIEIVEDIDAVLAIKQEYYNGAIGIEEVYSRLLDNYVYDQINMNTFNFINASFDNMYFRFPTKAEFDKAWSMIVWGGEQTLLGETGSSRDDYLHIVTHSREFYQGIIIWMYKTLMAREPTAEEIVEHMDELYNTGNLQLLQQEIMITDEYANFE